MRLADIPSRDILALLDRPGLKSMRDKLAALERLSPLRQSDTYKMVNSRGMEMAVVRVGGFGPSGITNTISYCHTSREGGVWRLLSEVIFHVVSTLCCEMCTQAYSWLRNKCPQVPHIECCNFGVAVLHNLLYILGGCFSQVFDQI